MATGPTRNGNEGYYLREGDDEDNNPEVPDPPLVSLPPSVTASSPPTSSSPVTRVKILFVRHSESCANMLKKVGGASRFIERVTMQVDPFLTARGTQMAQQRGSTLNAMITRFLGEEGALHYAGSGLRRTHLTAYNLLVGSGAIQDPDLQIRVLPHVNEMGMGADNKMVPESERDTLGGKVDFTLFNSSPNPSTPSADLFFEWLGRQNTLLPAAPTGSVVRMVIVTHGHWLSALSKKIPLPGSTQAEKIKYDNLDAAAVTTTYSNRTWNHDLQWIEGEAGRKILSGLDFDALAEFACPDRCPGTVICTGDGPGDMCTRLREAVGYDGAKLQKLATDLGIMEYYRREPRPEVLEAIRKLGSYGGAFGTGRGREFLAADLLPLQTAYRCGTEGAAPAVNDNPSCVALEDLYQRAERGDPVPFADIQVLLQKLRGRIEALPRADQKKVAVLEQYRTRTGFFKSREPAELVSDLKTVHDVLQCTSGRTPRLSKTVCEPLSQITPATPNANLTRIAMRLPTKESRNLLRSYAKPGGWFTRKKDRAGLPANVLRIKNATGCEESMERRNVTRDNRTRPLVGNDAPPPLQEGGKIRRQTRRRQRRCSVMRSQRRRTRRIGRSTGR
jgi:broad specificity phosphatase PhoE